MSKRDLELAQFFLITYQSAHAHAEQLDPHRTCGSFVVRKLDAILIKAASGFMDITGRVPREVSLHDLNTSTPAEWTKWVKPWRGE